MKFIQPVSTRLSIRFIPSIANSLNKFLLVFFFCVFEVMSEVLLFDFNPSTPNISFSTFQSIQQCAGNKHIPKVIIASSSPANSVFTIPPNTQIVVELEIVNSENRIMDAIFNITKSGMPTINHLWDGDGTMYSISSQEEGCGSKYFSYFRLYYILQPPLSALSGDLELNFELENPKLSFGIYSYRIFVSLCHPMCEICDSTNANICTECNGGYTPLNNGCSFCLANEVYQDGKCVFKCDTEYIQAGIYCWKIPNCQTADVNGQCLACKSSWFLFQGECLLKCPQFLIHNKTTNTCDEIMISTSGKSIKRYFYQAVFSSAEVLASGFNVIPAAIPLEVSVVWLCHDQQVLLGKFSGRKNSYINLPNNIRGTYKYLHVSFRFFIIDLSKTVATSQIKVTVKDVDHYITNSNYESLVDICGESNEDAYGFFAINVEYDDEFEIEPNSRKSINITCISDGTNISMGIREIQIVGFNCEENCVQCTLYKCIECQQGFTLDSNEQCICSNDVLGQDGKCADCHARCLTCSGDQYNQCKTCYDTMTLVGTVCEECPFGNYDTIAKCLSCSSSCQECKDNSSACLKTCEDATCSICPGNTPLFLGGCYSTCDNLAEGLHLNKNTNQCECSSATSIIVRVNGKDICTEELPFGYFCSNPSIYACTECKANCEVCATATTCKLCSIGYFIWNEDCLQNCFPSLSIIENTTDRKCQCEAGTTLKKRDAVDIQSSEQSQEYACFSELKLTQIEVINALSSSKTHSRKGIPSVLENNYFILTYNRRMTQLEFQTFNFYLMKDIFIRDSDYKIIKITLEETPSSSIIIEIEMPKNRRVSNFSVIIEGLEDKIEINNVVLVSKSLSETLSTQNEGTKSVTEGMESITNQLVNSDSEFLNKLTKFSKEFQLICSLSNFVQLLTPIYFLNASLPPLIKFGALLGASFIFREIPSSQNVQFSDTKTSSSTTRFLADSNNSDSSTTNNQQDLKSMLAGFGVTSNIFDNCIGVHILVFLAVLMMVICYSGRRIFTGKQYTMLVVDKISNYIALKLQSSITVILSILTFCFSAGEGVTIASMYLVFYTAIFLNTFFLTCSKSNEYLKQNIPNFFVDINYQAKGAKWYLVISIVKKHVVIFFFLQLYENPVVCCSLIASLFFIHAIAFVYFRFFVNRIIAVTKIIQELMISVLFITLAIILQQYQSMMESDDISNEDMQMSLKLANIILIFIVACVIVSFFISLYRFVSFINEMRDAWKKYQIEKQKNAEEKWILEQSMSIQMQQGFNSVLQVKQVYLQYEQENGNQKETSELN